MGRTAAINEHRLGLGAQIREVRQSLGMSVAAVATSLSVSAAAVRQWELGYSAPSQSNKRKLASLFQTDINFAKHAPAPDEPLSTLSVLMARRDSLIQELAAIEARALTISKELEGIAQALPLFTPSTTDRSLPDE